MPKNARIDIRATEEEKAELLRHAKAYGMSLSEYLVKCGLSAPEIEETGDED